MNFERNFDIDRKLEFLFIFSSYLLTTACTAYDYDCLWLNCFYIHLTSAKRFLFCQICEKDTGKKQKLQKYLN